MKWLSSSETLKTLALISSFVLLGLLVIHAFTGCVPEVKRTKKNANVQCYYGDRFAGACTLELDCDGHEAFVQRLEGSFGLCDVDGTRCDVSFAPRTDAGTETSGSAKDAGD